MNYSNECQPNRKTGDVAAEEVMRRISEVSGAFDLGELGIGEFDLRQDYENAINCLIQAESLIGSLQEQIASKDRRIAKLEDKINLAPTPKALQEQLASKDREITSLEEKIVEMSLELAVTKTQEHKLQHQLKASFTSVASTVSSLSISETSSSQHAVATPSPFESRHRLVRNSNRRKTQAQPQFRPRFGSCWGGSDNQLSDRSVDTSSTTVANTTMTGATMSGGQPQSLDESNTGRLFGQLFSLKNRGLKDGQLVQDFKKQEEEQGKDDGPLESQRPLHHCSQDQDVEQRPRRPPNRSARTALQKSSRSFLETQGVVFPVSSFEVMNKGCVPRIRNQGTTNEAWPEF